MTHASFSQENNKAFSIAGATIIETTVSFNVLSKDIDISAKELNRVLSLNSNVESSCAVDGMLLGLHKVVRVSSKTNSSSTPVLCGAFRSIFAAIAIDSGHPDTAGNVFLKNHGRHPGVYASL
jgi:dsRNA-specific ribonuclease